MDAILFFLSSFDFGVLRKLLQPQKMYEILYVFVFR